MGYPKEVYENAWQTLNHRKEEARGRAASRRDEVHRRLPEVSRIEKKMAVTAAGITKSIVTAPNEAAELIRLLGEENHTLQKERERLLVQAGYPADYLAEKYHCAMCKDSGYIGPKMCTCLQSLLKAEAYAWLGTAAPMERCSFESFTLSVYPDEPAENAGVIPRKRMGEVLAFCKKYAAGFSVASESLLFIGQTGLGKTHMSLAVAGLVTEQGYGVIYASAQKLMDKLEADKFSRAQDAREQYQDTMRIVLESDLLILDDLGAEFNTSFTTSALYNIVNTRMVERRPVIISTNLSLGEIESRYSMRMASRLLCEYQVLKFFGKDVRYIRKIAK